jgi:glycosyltransferase involved in cell wall biosynthesis
MNKKINILYLTTSPVMGGAEKQLYYLATQLDPERFLVKVCVLKSEDDGVLVHMLKEKGVHTESIGMKSKCGFFKLVKLWNIIREYQPDILQSFLFFDNIVGRIFGKLAGVRVIVSGQRNVEPYRSHVRNFLDKITLPLADYVVSNSEAGKHILIEREHVKGNKIEVIYNGIMEPEMHRTKKRDGEKKIVGFVGYMTKQKGVDILLEAAHMLGKGLPNIEFVLVGDGSQRKYLEKLAKKLEMGNTVRFMGHRKRPTEQMKEFDVLAVPSLWEGVPNVILEAMMYGIPVVASRVGGVPEVIEEGVTGFLVKPRDACELAKKIEYMLRMRPEERMQMSENEKATARKKFSMDHMVAQFEKFYERANGQS